MLCTIGKSRAAIDCTASWPRPGQANTVSTITAPASRLAISSAEMVMIGVAALRRMWRLMTRRKQQALGLRGRDVVAAELLEHGGARDAREGRHGERAERDRRQDHGAYAVDAGGRHHAKGHGEQQDQQDAAPEGRHALPDQHERHQEALEPRAAPHRHQDADRQPDADRDDQRAAREIERVGQPRRDDVGDRDALHQRLAEIEARELRPGSRDTAPAAAGRSRAGGAASRCPRASRPRAASGASDRRRGAG